MSVDSRSRKILHLVEILYENINTTPIVFESEEDDDEEVCIIPVYFAYLSSLTDGIELNEWFDREKETIKDVLECIGVDDSDVAFRDLYLDCNDEKKLNTILSLKALFSDDFDDFIYYTYYNYDPSDTDAQKYEIIKRFLTNDFLDI